MRLVSKLAHFAIGSPDRERLADYYTSVIGFTRTGDDEGATYLSAGADLQTVAIHDDAENRLLHLGLTSHPQADLDDIAARLKEAGVEATRKSDAEPGIAELIEFNDAEGNTLQIFTEQANGPGFSGRGIQPNRFQHLCQRAVDVKKVSDFYEEVLGCEWSDWMGDFFVFLRCNADHHTFNFVKGPAAGNVLHHLAFELRDITEVQPACDLLAKHGHHLVWGPGRHGPGHNLYTYHRDPDGNVVELFTQLDVMTDETSGVFDPRPWHEDNPQRPKVWKPGPLAPNSWGIGPPEGFL